MNTLVISSLLTLLLLAVPMYVLSLYGINLMRKLVKLLLKAVCAMLVMGCVMALAIHFDHWAINLLVMIVLIVMSMVIVLVKSRAGSKFVFPLLGGMIVGCGVVELYTLLVVSNWSAEMRIKAMVPVLGILLFITVPALIGALKTYLSGIKHHSQLYYYQITNGATPEQSADYFLRRSMKVALLENMGNMATIVIGTAPVFFWTLILCGIGAAEAAFMQVLLFVASLSSTVLTVWSTLIIARRLMRDKYGNLKND